MSSGYITWICANGSRWGLEQTDPGRMCHHRRFKDCQNEHCSGRYPKQDWRDLQ